jgi:hypothetical protein
MHEAIAEFRAEVMDQLREMKSQMADVSNVLNEVADGLRGPLATSIQELIAENAALKGEDAAESTAAANVKAAFDEVASKFTPVDEVPDVPPLDDSGTVDDSGVVVDDGTETQDGTNPSGNPVA